MTLYDSDMTWIAEADDCDDELNFVLAYEYVAGDTYYFDFYDYNDDYRNMYLKSFTDSVTTDMTKTLCFCILPAVAVALLRISTSIMQTVCVLLMTSVRRQRVMSTLPKL